MTLALAALFACTPPSAGKAGPTDTDTDADTDTDIDLHLDTDLDTDTGDTAAATDGPCPLTFDPFVADLTGAAPTAYVAHPVCATGVSATCEPPFVARTSAAVAFTLIVSAEPPPAEPASGRCVARSDAGVATLDATWTP